MALLTSLNPRDVAAIDLGRILSRLEKKILSAESADPRLQHSSYERIKTSAVRYSPSLSPFLLSWLGYEKIDGVANPEPRIRPPPPSPSRAFVLIPQTPFPESLGPVLPLGSARLDQTTRRPTARARSSWRRR